MPRGSLAGIRVLLTTTAETADAGASRFRDLGAELDVAPCIRIGPPPDPQALVTAAARVADYAWLAFTSRSGVRALANLQSTLAPGRPKLAVIGTATAQEIREAFSREPDLVPAEFVAEVLASALIERCAPGDCVLVLQAQDARPALVTRLRAAGIHVDAVVAYSTLEAAPADLAERLQRCHAVVFASGSAVRAAVQRLRAATDLRGKVVVGIGPVTASELRHAGIAVEIVPEHATLEAAADALARYFHPES